MPFPGNSTRWYFAAVYTYNMSDAIDARLAMRVLSGAEVGEFHPNRTECRGVSGDRPQVILAR